MTTANHTLNGTPLYTYEQLSTTAKERAFHDCEGDAWFIERATELATTAGEKLFYALCEEKGIKAEISLYPHDYQLWAFDLTTDLVEGSDAYDTLVDIADQARKKAEEVDEEESTQSVWETLQPNHDSRLYTAEGEYLGKP